jgi:hypothetical protein
MIGKITPDGKHVEECPKADHDVTSPSLSHWPRESYRSGSTGFWDFWMHQNPKLATIYMNMRTHPWTNDGDIANLKPYAQEILAISESEFNQPDDIDRLRWLQHWTRTAVELYGEEAGISFS